MEQKHYLYSYGEFAKRAGVNKRTLHYYNDIGLFCPEVIEENGYHYYTCFQFAQLEMILTLRKIGLSIEEIREYASSPSDDSFSRIMEKRKLWIEESIQQLLSEQSFLEQKAERLKIAMNAKHGSIQLCSLPQQKILISSAITGKYDEADFSVAADFSLRLKETFHLYDSFGSRISMDSIRRKHFNSYSSFFAYCPHTSEAYDEILPAGTYLRSFCIGTWDKLPQVYRSILSYAKEHHLLLTGYAYEEGLNEMALKNQADYITMITIPCSVSDLTEKRLCFPEK